jgi:arylformamidase
MKYKMYDLSHPFSIHSLPFVGYPSPTVQWIKRKAGEHIFAQQINTPLHVSTHIDAPSHWLGPGAKDMASIPLDRLFGPAAIADLSDVANDWYLITPKDVTSRVDVFKGDIVILKTGFYKYYLKDEFRYMFMHPAPGEEFAKWCLKMKLRWIGIDCASADHAVGGHDYYGQLYPNIVRDFEAKTGKKFESVFPKNGIASPMHELLFPHDIIHVENIGGDIASLGNCRCYVGAFPWKFEGGEASICRVVAFMIEE